MNYEHSKWLISLTLWSKPECKYSTGVNARSYFPSLAHSCRKHPNQSARCWVSRAQPRPDRGNQFTRPVDNVESDNIFFGKQPWKLPKEWWASLFFGSRALFTWSHNHRLIIFRYEQVNRMLMGDDSFVYHRTRAGKCVWVCVYVWAFLFELDCHHRTGCVCVCVGVGVRSPTFESNDWDNCPRCWLHTDYPVTSRW